MSNVYDMSGKKKVIITDDTEMNITYKEIMKIVIEHATEEGCHQIFCYGGIDMCPSDIFGIEIIDKHKEQDRCNYESIGCTKCWTEAVKHIKGDNGNDKRRNNKIMETSVQYRTNCE